MDDLQQQLEEAWDEAELNLLQLQQVQEELEFYFRRCQELDRQLEDLRQIETLGPHSSSPDASHHNDPGGEHAELTSLRIELANTQAELSALKAQRLEEQRLLSTAQTMLEGQARYLEDVSLREEQAAQAVESLRLLEAEILYYLHHSQPQANLDVQRINRLVQLAQQADVARR